MKLIGILAGLMLTACGPRIADFPFECPSSGYAAVRSVGPAGCTGVSAGVSLSGVVLGQAGVWAQPARANAIVQQTLLVNSVVSWTDAHGRLVSGETFAEEEAVEVEVGLTSLLHEELHVMLGHDGDNHDGWEALGFWGLDTYFSDQVGEGMAWNCAPGRGMTSAIIDGLRTAGRPMDDFLKHHPDCLNKD